MPSRNNGPIAPPRDWDALRRAYEAPGADPIQVAATNNITLPTLRRYARDKTWTRTSAAPTAPAGGRATGPPVRVSIRPGALIRRLRTTVILKLEQLEMDILANPTLSPTDHERHSRAIGTLVKAAEIRDGLTGLKTLRDARRASGWQTRLVAQMAAAAHLLRQPPTTRTMSTYR